MAWQTHAAAAGGVNGTFEVYHQDDALGCGPACVAMVMGTSFGNDFVSIDPFHGLAVNAPPVVPPVYIVNLATYGLISHLITIG